MWKQYGAHWQPVICQRAVFVSALLSVRDFGLEYGNFTLKPLSFALRANERLAIVGESGSGKSLLALSLLGLSRARVWGSAEFCYNNATYPLTNLNPKQFCALRGQAMGYIPQEPLTALNPLHTIKAQILEALALHNRFSAKTRESRYFELLEKVGLESLKAREKVYPYELSGGERQRVLIAIALANNPALLIADEPTTALDASLQQQILKLLSALVAESQSALILISHNLPLVRQHCENVLVLQKGELRDYTTTENLFAPNTPKSAYSSELLATRLPPKPAAPQTQTPLLQTQNLSVSYPTQRNFWGSVKSTRTALSPLSFTLYQQHNLGIIGESGSGKSSLGFALMGLVAKNGNVRVADQNTMREARLELAYRAFIQMLFQDPFGALNPRLSVFEIIAEPLRIHRHSDIAAKTKRAMEQVALSADYATHYPNELSGGERQRVALARALVLQPRVLILDEPTSALDHSLRASIVALLQQIAKDSGITYICISHELDIIQALCERVIVLQHGKVVEEGQCAELFSNPKQPYTQSLLAAVTSVGLAAQQDKR